MNRYLTAPLILLLGAASVDAVAQERGRSGARDEAAHHAELREHRGDRGDRSDHSGKRDERPSAAAGSWGGSPSYGRGGSAPSAFQGRGAQPYEVARDDRGRGRDHDRGRDHEYGYDRGRGRGHDDRRDYHNAYGATDYRRGLPRSDGRDHRYDRHDRYDHRRNDYRHDHRHRSHVRIWHSPDWRHGWHHGWNGHRYRAHARYYYPSGYAARSWRIGYQLPLAFLIASYYVDYRPYGLAPPPYGTRWVRVDRDLLLVDVDDGEIVDILYGFFY